MIMSDEAGAAVESPSRPRLAAVDDPTPREMRRRRDMVFVMLHHRCGLSADEIASACKYAALTPRHIRRRIAAASRALSLGGGGPGG